MSDKKKLYEYAINEVDEDGNVTGALLGFGHVYATSSENAKMKAILEDEIDDIDSVEVLVRPFC